jgi:hypothetical protein
MANGKWQMANGKWQMANGKWQMASYLEPNPKISNQNNGLLLLLNNLNNNIKKADSKSISQIVHLTGIKGGLNP